MHGFEHSFCSKDGTVPVKRATGILLVSKR